MSIFGDETITPDQSPFEDGQEDVGAVDAETENEADESDSDEGEYQNQSEEDEDDGAPEDGQAHDDPVAALGFKSAEEMAHSYRELRKSYTQSRQQLSQSPQGQQQPPAQSGQGQDDHNAVFWANFRDNPLGTMQYLIQQASGQIVQQHVSPLVEREQSKELSLNIEAVAKEYRQINTPDGMKSLMERVADIAEDFGNPGLAANPSKRILDMAARELYGDSKAKVYQQAKAKGRQEAEATRSKKAGLSAPTGSKKAPPVTPEQQIINDIFGAGGGGIFG